MHVGQARTRLHLESGSSHMPMMFRTGLPRTAGRLVYIWCRPAACVSLSRRPDACSQHGGRTLAVSARTAPHVPDALLQALTPGLFTITKIEGQGRGLVALKPIPYATELFREEPVINVAGAKYRKQVCHGCLAVLGSGGDVVHAVSGSSFCSHQCMQVSSERFHEVEAVADLTALTTLCDQSGARFPLLTARLAAATMARAAAVTAKQLLVAGPQGTSGQSLEQTPSVTAAARQKDGGASSAATASTVDGSGNSGAVESTRMPGSTAAGAAGKGVHMPGPVVLKGGYGDVLPFLSFAHVPPPYPPQWVEEHRLLIEGLRPAADWLAGLLVSAGWHSDDTRLGQKKQEGQREDASGEMGKRVLIDRLLSELSLDWYVSLQARVAINSFRVDTVVLPSYGGGALGGMAAALLRGAGDDEGEVGVLGGGTGSAVFVVGSLFNHSCEPNVDVVFPKNNSMVAFRAARDIEAGEQLCISYLDPDLPVRVRQRQLAYGYGFRCGCRACREDLEDEGVRETKTDV